MSRLCPLLYRSSPASHNEEAVSCSTSAMLKGDCAILLLCCNYISAGHTAPEENGGVVFEFASGESVMQYLSCNTCHALELCHNGIRWCRYRQQCQNPDSPRVRLSPREDQTWIVLRFDKSLTLNASTFHRPVINWLVNNELVRNCAQV